MVEEKSIKSIWITFLNPFLFLIGSLMFVQPATPTDFLIKVKSRITVYRNSEWHQEACFLKDDKINTKSAKKKIAKQVYRVSVK